MSRQPESDEPEKEDVGMGLANIYVDLCFHASSPPCLHNFWYAIPTSFYFF